MKKRPLEIEDYYGLIDYYQKNEEKTKQFKEPDLIDFYKNKLKIVDDLLLYLTKTGYEMERSIVQMRSKDTSWDDIAASLNQPINNCKKYYDRAISSYIKHLKHSKD